MPVQYKPAVTIGDLRPHPANVRTHSKKQITQIAQSIETIGFTSPIVVDEAKQILAGHGRWLAAKQLGIRHVPIVIVTGLSDALRRAYLLADNKLTENAGWDRKGLALEMSDLSLRLTELGLDIGLTGFEAAEMDRLLSDYVDAEEEPADNVPSLSDRPISEIGDVWTLGSHRVICGDAKDEGAIRKLMQRERADMVFTDPPYNVRIASIQGRGRIRHRDFVQGSGELTASAFTSFLKVSLSLAAKFSQVGSLHYVCIDWRHLRELLDAADDVYPGLLNLVVWAKSNAGQDSFYRSQHELIFVFRHGDGSPVNNVELGRHGRNRTNVWQYAGNNTFRPGRMNDLATHPTVKPVALVADAIRDCTRRGEIVLDPFLGAGSTILAAERVGRRGFGVELDPRFVDTAIRRWESFAKRDAVFAKNGKTFADVAMARTR